MPRKLNLTGHRFGRLTVLTPGPPLCSGGRDLTTWTCRCECGETSTARTDNLRNGRTVSCGCGMGHGRHFATHAMSDTVEFAAWVSAKQRCFNLKHKAYKNYGGRGIAMCDAWRLSFEQFYTDMGPRPSAEHSLDRFPDNDGNYEPGNCRWATASEQAQNRRSSRPVHVEQRRSQ